MAHTFVAAMGREGISPLVASEVAKCLGATTIDELTLEDFGYIEMGDLKAALADVTMEGKKLTALEKGRIYKVHR
jgi:hypothetical protein